MELQKLTEANHTTTAKLRVPDGSGGTEAVEVKVVYRPIDANVLKEFNAIQNDSTRTAAHQAALLVKSLPDVTQNGEPVQIGLELFEAMDSRHPAAIVGAILEHYNEGKG